MSRDADDRFYKRADTHIHVANEQLEEASRGQVSASMMYATARFNAWVSACKASSGDDLAGGKDEIIDYFVEQYREMLDENIDDYARNFTKYMGTDGA